MIRFTIPVILVFCFACHSQPGVKTIHQQQEKSLAGGVITPYDTAITTIHVLVALCDNKYQGIVPVPAGIGNGQDPNSNLYWGCGYGVRTYFKNSTQWKLVKCYAVDSLILERLIFKHHQHNACLIADAYNGQYIRQCTVDFLKSCAGEQKDTITMDHHTIGSSGNAKLLAYIGHDGLMDFKITDTFPNKDGRHRDAMILACYSRNFFWPHLWYTRANPLIWTSGLMCPEAYTLHDAIESWLNKEPAEVIRNSAANAYSRYQHGSVKAAKHLLVSGWK